MEIYQGNIIRQEAVSMFTPLLLDVHPGQSVVDMCAAPGSKTSQIASYLAADTPEDCISGGVVVANDANAKRAYLLVNKMQRMNLTNFLVITHPGQGLPRITV